MGDFIRRTLLFCLFGLFLYFLSLILLTATDLGSHVPTIVVKTRGFQSNRNKESRLVESPLDIAFLGSSEVFTGFNPSIFKEKGIHTFNFGSNAQTPTNSLFVYEKYVRSKRPNYLVFDVYWTVFELDGIEAFIDITTNDTLTIREITLGVKSHVSPILLNSVLYAWTKQQIFNVYPADFSNRENVKYMPGGFVENRSTQRDKLHLLSNRDVKSLDEQIEAFEMLIQRCKEDGVKVILVKTPVTKEYYNSITNQDQFFSMIKSIADKNDIPFMDLII